MELKVKEVAIPSLIEWNYEELKAEIQEKVRKYQTLVYTDDQIKDAKADRATLNRTKKALNDERIRMEKEYMAPFTKFKNQVGEIIRIIDEPVQLIDTQIKEYEEQKRREKNSKIVEYFEQCDRPEWLEYEQIFKEKWLNASMSMKLVQAEINEWLGRIRLELATIAQMPEFSFEAAEVYKSTLDLGKAIQEGRRLAEIQKRKAEAGAARVQREAEKAAEPIQEESSTAQEPRRIEPIRQWIAFQANLTAEDGRALKQFFNSRGIEFRAI